jgi:hypothetical protein
VALWLLIAAAAAGGLRGCVVGTSAPPVAEQPGAAQSAGGFAELFVATFLEAGAGQEQSLRPYYPGAVDLSAVAPQSRYAARMAIVSSTGISPGYWAVTVGAAVLVAAQGGFVQAGTHYYQVGVAGRPGTLVATSLPAEVPAPVPAALPPLAVAGLAQPGSDAVSGVLSHFFEAYLCGRGELAPLVTTGSHLAAVSPAPFSSAEVGSLAVGPVERSGTALARVEVTGTDSSGLKEVLDYSLHIRNRRGEWAVEEMLPGAPLAPPHTGR